MNEIRGGKEECQRALLTVGRADRRRRQRRSSSFLSVLLGADLLNTIRTLILKHLYKIPTNERDS